MGGAIYGAFATPAELSTPPALHQGRFSFLLSEETEATRPSQGYPPPFVSGGGGLGLEPWGDQCRQSS